MPVIISFGSGLILKNSMLFEKPIKELIEDSYESEIEEYIDSEIKKKNVEIMENYQENIVQNELDKNQKLAEAEKIEDEDRRRSPSLRMCTVHRVLIIYNCLEYEIRLVEKTHRLFCSLKLTRIRSLL